MSKDAIGSVTVPKHRRQSSDRGKGRLAAAAAGGLPDGGHEILAPATLPASLRGGNGAYPHMRVEHCE
ncbi:hypothetical protein BOQ54_12615 [Chelatococcus daeguensis]|uniref:Uncharacterized protein n=1 Tax=Chelatococcus daeguensis TaxID=444444 RepID=A0AAC9JQ06_9HYPH|nr:hypothetical protein BOQ54_12615 [Chelatococcus daeguensis]